MALRQEQEQLQSRIQSLMQRAPVWLAAQNSLNQLSEQCGEEFTSSQDVTEFLQQLLEREREAIVERDEVGARKNAVDEEIERLSQPGGSEDQRLNALAERFGGVLLSEIYDDVSLEDAPYFSTVWPVTPRHRGARSVTGNRTPGRLDRLPGRSLFDRRGSAVIR